MAINSLSTGWRPGVCTSSTRPTAPYEGQVIYETDTDKTLVWNGSAWLYLSTPQTTEPGAYQSYTPTWTSLTVGNGTQAFSYTQVNKMVHVFGRITFGSTTSISSTPLFTLPVNRADANLAVLGTATLGDSGTGTYAGYPLSTAANNCYMFRIDHTVGATVLEGAVTATSPFTWVTNDFIQINLMYPGV